MCIGPKGYRMGQFIEKGVVMKNVFALPRSSFLGTIWLALLLVFLLTANSAFAALDNKGTDFILGFLPNADLANTVELHLTSDTSTNVTVQYPVNSPSFNTTVAVNPGSVTIVGIPNVASNWPANTVANNAVRAFAADEFVAYMINRRSASTDAALGLPVDTMNTEYLVMTSESSNINSGDRGEFVVVAAFDNTTVRITPTKPLAGGRIAGVPFDVVLNRGQGYLGQSTTAGVNGDLTGTIISADRPVGMSNGNKCNNVPPNTFACDHVFEVAQPVQSWGTQILAANLPNRPNGSVYKVLASEDGTTISQNGSTLGIFNRGEFASTSVLPGNQLFTADKPIYVDQFMTGQSFPGATLGDPAMGNMIPSAQYLSKYTFSTVGGNQFVQNYLTVIAEDADVAGGTILLDGTAIPAVDFMPITSTGFSVAVVALSQGTHNTSSNGKHGITVEGYNNFDSYIYPGGALFEFINPSGDSNPPICSTQFNAGPPPFFTGTTTDNRPSEDVNNNGVLDAGEDLNNNGVIDKDTGIFFVALEGGATNLNLVVTPFVPGDGSVSFTVGLTNTNLAGSGTVRVTDGAGNICQTPVSLGGVPSNICDFNADGAVDIDDINLVKAARGTSASQFDVDNDGTVTVNDARKCVLECTNARCAK